MTSTLTRNAAPPGDEGDEGDESDAVLTTHHSSPTTGGQSPPLDAALSTGYNSFMKSSQYVALFVDEAGLLLEQCLSCLEQLENSITDLELHRELFRLVHTLKGMASTLVELPYFEEITQLSHCVEALLELQNNALAPEHLYLLADSFQALGDLIHNVASPDQSAPVPLDSIYARFKGLTHLEAVLPINRVNHQEHVAQPLHLDIQERLRAEQLQQQGQTLYEIRVELMQACLMKSVRALLVMFNLEQKSEILTTQPPMDLLREGAFDNSFSVLVASALTAAELGDLAESVSEIEDVEVLSFEGPAQTASESAAVEPVAVPDPSGLNEFELHLLEEAMRMQLNAIWLRFRIHRKVQLQPARISLIFNQLEAHGEVIKTLPAVPDLEAEKFDQLFELLVISPETPEALRKHLMDEADIQSWLHLEAHLHGQDPPLPPLPPLQAPPEASVLRISPAGGDARESLMLPQHSPELPESERLKNIRMQHLVRVDSRQLDLLNELTGELLLIRSRMNQTGSPAQLRQELTGLNRIMALLQAVSMKLQTVTAAHVFHRYPRMVRDLARSLGKEISCRLYGEQVEISRAYVDDLSSVLLHMIRNSADHGLETSSERLRLGKPRQGTIVLSASYDGQEVLIEVRDDGRGIDVEALKQKALNQNLMSREAIDALGPEESLQLIFSPGLSTSAAATDISGRGVGMDVVRNHIQQVGGTLHVESNPGQGTRFLISLPSAFRQIRSLLVRAEQQYYALPFEQVTKIRQGLEVKGIEESAEGSVIALQSLTSRNGHTLVKPESIVLQIRNGDRPVWLIADELIGAQDLAVRQLANGSEDIVRGAAMLGAEDVALFLEPELLLKMADA